MNKKIIAIAFVIALAVPYGAKLIARRKTNTREIENRLKDLNQKIEQLEQSMEKSEELCEVGQTNAICSYANEDVSVKGIDLARLKRQRKRLQKELNAQNGVVEKKKKDKKLKSKKDKKKKRD